MPPLSLKRQASGHKEQSPVMLRRLTRLKQQYSLLCKSIISAVYTKIFFHTSGFITVFPKLLAFRCTSQLEMNLVQLAAVLQITLKVISTARTPSAFKQHSREMENCQKRNKMLPEELQKATFSFFKKKKNSSLCISL